MLNRFCPLFFRGMLLAAVCLIAACTEKKAEAIQQEPPPVTVATVERKTVPVEISAIGTVEPYSRVEIKTRVSGHLQEVHFREGQDVRQGDLLFTIDPRPFQTALQQAEANLARERAMLTQLQANLARDEAEAEFAESQARRYRKLVDEGISSPEQADQFETNAKARKEAVEAGKAALDTARASVQADEAAVRSAKVQLSFCTVASPINGRTGALLVNEGNVVKDNETVLVTINQVAPAYVNFAVPEKYLPEIRRHMAAGVLRVEARIRSDESEPVVGVLTFIDNMVDETTGTIRLKGTFENSDRRLWPGEFVDTALRISAQVDVAVAPARAVQTGQNGQYVFVVTLDHIAEMRPVVGGRAVGLDMVIEKGVQPGDVVITDGHLRVAPGMKVNIRNEQASQEPL
jgi:multidrug efflux system membrane fusion protein